MFGRMILAVVALAVCLALSGETFAQSPGRSAGQAKANRNAAMGRLSHRGPLAGQYEGVGFSTRSADDAIRNCCYWGQRKPTSISVAKGRNGYYAVVGYR